MVPLESPLAAHRAVESAWLTERLRPPEHQLDA